MDYDGNDFQSQSFQLASEENTKFPPGLRSFALPKFDLDDNLQAHLRFDSLVETEVLLGIQSQEDNRWIEEFSRGSSGIEFSSGAAESCSISRHNNVWSEATSSESVEMLLESVGQDEMIAGQAVIEELGACDGLGTLTKQMEPSLNQDGSVPSTVGNVVDIGPTLSPEKCLENFYVVGDDAVTKVHQAEATPQTNKGEESGSGSSKDLGPSMVDEKCGIPVTKGNVLIDGKYNGANQREVGSLVDGSVENKTQDNSVASEGMEVDHSATSVQNLVASVGELNTQDQDQVMQGCNQVISYEYPESSQANNAEEGGEHLVLRKKTLVDDHNCEGNMAETGINNVDNFSNLGPNVDSTMQVTEGCSEGVSSEQPVQVSEREAVSSSKNTEMCGKFVRDKDETSFVVVRSDNSFEVQAIEVSNNNAGIQSSRVLKLDPQVQISQGQSNVLCFDKQEDLLKGDSHQLECGISVGNSETTLLIDEDNEHFKGQCHQSGNNHVGNPSSLMVELCSSTDIIHVTQASGNIRDSNDSVGVHDEDYSAEDHISSSVQVESKQTCESSLVIESSDVHDSPSDVSVLEREQICESSLVIEPNDASAFGKENVKLPTDSSNMKGEIDDSLIVEKRVSSLSQGQSTAKIEVVVHISPSDRIVGDKSASTGYVSEHTNLASCNKSNGVHHLLPGNCIAIDKVIGEKDDEKSGSCVGGSPHFDKKEETVIDISSEPSSLVMKECSRMTSEPVPMSELEQCAVHDSAGELLTETVGQPPSTMGAISITCQDESQAVMADKITRENSVELEGHPVINDLVLKENDVEVVGVSHDKYEEASFKIAGIMPTHGEKKLTRQVPSSLEESFRDIVHKDQKDSKVSLASGDNNDGKIVPASTEGDAINGCEGSYIPAAVSKDNNEFNNVLEAGSSNPNSEEANCGSPTVISCSELCQSEKEKCEGDKGSIDQNATVSDDVDGEARKVGSNAHDPIGSNAAEDDRSFTFEVSSQADLPDRGWKPFPSIQPYEFPQIKEASPPTTSSLCQMDPKMLAGISSGSSRASDRENVRGSSKGTAGHKSRKVSSKATDRENAKEGKSLKEVTPVKLMKDRGGSSRNASPRKLGARSQVVQVEEMQPFGYIEGSARKPRGVPTVQTSSLPDLNTSASLAALFQQPFTDLQQVQLRAQIFVYGSLIQGTTPDEACMISAFGETDGGRSVWDNAWRASIERLHIQKSPSSNPETALQSNSGARAHEQATRQGALQSKALGTPAGRAGSKAPLSAIPNPVIPLSSPRWSVATPSRDGLQSGSIPRGPLLDAHQTLSPLHPFQSPHARHYFGNTTPWFSQAPFAGPWVVSPQTSGLDTSAHYPALPIAETSHVTSVRESSILSPSAMQHLSPSPLVHSGAPTSVPAGNAPLLEAQRATASPGKQAAVDPRPRKRKKSLASQREPVSTAGVTNPLLTSVAYTTTTSSVAKIASGNSISTASPISSSHYQIIGVRDTEQKVIFSDETCSKVEQAKLQAEEAAALAATAVKHSQGIWSQLAIQKNSGLVSEVEAKLASAAVAVAAAASVAKAAAAAAKIASDAALQAKLMANEALVLGRNGDCSQRSEASHSDGVKSLGRVTPSSILKGMDRTTGSGSVIVTAKEASRRRVEDAAAATKRAENMDAVVKAAELAAEAVSQAGAIIAMGDPIPLTLSELVEAGPDGFWKVHQATSEQLVKSSDTNRGGKSTLDGVEGLDRTAKHFNKQSTSKLERQGTTDQGKLPSLETMASHSVESQMGLVNGMHWDSVISNEMGLGGQKGRKMSDLAKTIGVVPESEIGSKTDTVTVQNEEHEKHHPVGSSNDNSIKEGSLVEVLSDDDSLKRVWHSAKVLSLKDGEAYVCYSEPLSDEGSGQHKKWVPLEGEAYKAPRIRIARPMTAMKFEGTRKRRRAAIGDYVWSVGDRVDVWTHDGWWEGIITEKSKEDETMLTVHFHDKGDASIVRPWHLRPSLIWNEGQWMEWSHSRENNSCLHEGDTLQEKRPKLGRHRAEIDLAVEAKDKDKISKSTGTGKLEESRPLALSAKEKIFTVGKNIREGNNSETLGRKRTGMQKEGSGVIFGVPKPGKKRKFMEVSKHYVADTGGQTNEGNDSIKFAKYLIPQGSGSRGWRNTSKVDSKGKRAAESKSKVLKSGRTSKNLSEKGSSLTYGISASNDGTVPDHLPKAKDSVGHDVSISERQSMLEIGSSQNTFKATEDPTLFSSLALASDALFSRKKPSSAVEAALGGRGKFGPLGLKLARNEEKDTGHYDNPGKSITDAVEPRRSNRKIQPTSRLLEGLQSSLIISKIPTVSHDKGTKAHRSVPLSRGNLLVSKNV